MPDSTQGFSGSEIVDYVISYIGNNSQEFRAVVTALLPMAEYRYCKAHDWKFLARNNLSLTVASGTDEYTLDTAAIDCEMKAEDVHSVYSTTNGIYLKRTTLEELRRFDVKQDDGNAESMLTMWAPANDNTIVVYPKVFGDTELKIDGKASPSALLTLSNYPSIPFRNQESFIKYIIAQVMERENDGRAAAVKQEAVGMIRQDIQDDMAGNSSSADEPRVKHWWEAGNDGVGGDLEPMWISSMFR